MFSVFDVQKTMHDYTSFNHGEANYKVQNIEHHLFSFQESVDCTNCGNTTEATTPLRQFIKKKKKKNIKTREVPKWDREHEILDFSFFFLFFFPFFPFFP